VSWPIRLLDRDGGFVAELVLRRRLLPQFITDAEGKVYDTDHPAVDAEMPRYQLSIVLGFDDGGPLAVYRRVPTPSIS
jgi:hypothetical protein